MVALILAAGYATRLYPYTLTTPKPLLPVCDKPIITYIMEEIKTLPDVKKVVVISNNKFYSQFKNWEKEQSGNLIKVINDGTNTVDDRLGAIGDIRFAIETEKIEDDFIVIAGDNIFTFKLKDYYSFFKSVNENCVCVKEINDYEALKQFGVCRLSNNNKVIGFTEKPSKPETNTAVFAVYMFKKNTLRLINEFLNSKNKGDAPGYFLEWLYKKTDVYAYKFDGDCYDIGTVSAYENIRSSYKDLR